MLKQRTTDRRSLSHHYSAHNAGHYVAATLAANGSGFRNIADFARAVRLANPAAADAFQMDSRLATLPAVLRKDFV